MTLGWLALLVLCGAAIGRAGFVLSDSADRLASLHGWGRGWVGMALLATVTSLPELASGIASVSVVGDPDLAVGNALGACVVNLGFLAIVDAMQRRQPMYREASTAHLLSAGFGVVMLGLVAFAMVVGERTPALLHVGLSSPLLLVLYLGALRAVEAHERAPADAPPPPGAAAARGEWRRFAVAAVAVLVAGLALPAVASGLADALGLSSSFVGTVFMAVVTTLPEMAVTLSALRIGALDLAIGNLLGSNLFNVLVLAVDDAAYTRGPLLAGADAAHLGTAIAAVVMTGLVVIGLVMRPQRRVLRVATWVSVALATAALLNATLLYLAG